MIKLKDYIYPTSVNSLVVENTLNFVGYPIKESIFNNEIVNLYIGDIEISKGDGVEIPIEDKNGNIITESLYYIHNIIKENSKYIISTRDINKSMKYLLPLLEYNKSEIGYEYIENTFINIDNDDLSLKDVNKIFILYRFLNTERFRKKEFSVAALNKCFDKIDVDPYHVLYAFKIDDKFSYDYQKITNGEYSKISNESKKIILNFYDNLIDEPNISKKDSIFLKRNIEKVFNRDKAAIKELAERIRVKENLIKELDSKPSDSEIYTKININKIIKI